MPLKAAKKPARKPARNSTKNSTKKVKTKAPAKKKSAGKIAGKRQTQKTAAPARRPAAETELLKRVLASLNDDKAENVITIDLRGRSALCDAAVIASGRSSRHVGAMAEHLARRLKESGYGTRPVSGQAQGDWVLVDAGDVIVHLFRPEVRDYYDLEGMWSVGSRK